MRAETEKRVLEEIGQDDNQRQLPTIKRACLSGGDQVRAADGGRCHEDTGAEGAQAATPGRSGRNLQCGGKRLGSQNNLLWKKRAL